MHRAIPYWFYWCWNANSGDTGQSVLSTHLLVPFTHTHYLLFTWFVTSLQLISILEFNNITQFLTTLLVHDACLTGF